MIREIKLQDAKSYLDLLKVLDQESTYMLFEPDERSQTLSQLEDHLKDLTMSPVKTIFVAEEEGTLVGFIEVFGDELKRIRHRACLVIGIREAYQGRGLGKELLSQTIEWAKANALNRLELTVIAHNKKALWLFSRMGFTVEGTRRKAMYVENAWRDEFYMSLFL
jgi:RimJ/RimL family protein N-acetyltransferase